ncbi:hypothetical protein AB4027_01605 [Alkalibacterium putridalgicola]
MQEQSANGRIDTVSKVIAASLHTLDQAFVDSDTKTVNSFR